MKEFVVEDPVPALGLGWSVHKDDASLVKLRYHAVDGFQSSAASHWQAVMVARQHVVAIGLREQSHRLEQPCQAVMGLRVRRLFGKDFTVGRDGRVAFLVRANLSPTAQSRARRPAARILGRAYDWLGSDASLPGGMIRIGKQPIRSQSVTIDSRRRSKSAKTRSASAGVHTGRPTTDSPAPNDFAGTSPTRCLCPRFSRAWLLSDSG